MRTQVIFDGFELSRHFHVSNLRTSLLPRTVKTREVPGRDGSLYLGASHAARTITMTLSVMGKAVEERQQASRMLAAILAVDEPRPLSLSIDSGLWYMAVPVSDGDGSRYRNATTFDVAFECPDPIAYGRERTVTVPSGGSVSFEVGGTHPTMPHVSAAAAKKGSSGFWRLTLEDGSFFAATIPSNLSTAPVAADCATRVLRVNGDVSLLDPSADWLVLAPGRHTLTMNGTGAATVTFNERWL